MLAPDHHDARGLAADASIVSRRRALRFLGGAGAATFLASCGPSKRAGSAGTSTTATSTTAATATPGVIPEETAGPFPGDGSNGVNVLTEGGIVRRDIRPSFGSSTAVAEGVDTTVKLTIVEAGSGRPLEGAAVYLWHCDRDGQYSLYSSGARNENYLRGVQAAGADGVVTFTTILPACYPGRWPHIHFEVYSSFDEATSAARPIATSQLALPENVCNAVYVTDGYRSSPSNLAQVSLATDNVFRDGAALETPAVTGAVAGGYLVSLTVAVRTA